MISVKNQFSSHHMFVYFIYLFIYLFIMQMTCNYFQVDDVQRRQ